MRGGRAEDDVLERGEARVLEVAQAAEVHRPHLDRERVRELRDVVREQVRGDGDGDVLEPVLRGERVRVDRPERRVRRREREERWGAREARRGHAVRAGQGGERRVRRLERRLEAQDGHTVYDVQHDVEHDGRLRQGERAQGRGGEGAAEEVGRDGEKPLAVSVEGDVVCGEEDDVGEEAVDLEVWGENQRRRAGGAAAACRLLSLGLGLFGTEEKWS